MVKAMGDKRPWTLGPWEIEDNTIYSLIPRGQKEINKWWAGFQTSQYFCSNHELHSNAKLASKAPEMAELLIELCKIATDQVCNDVFGRLGDVYDKAEKFLKEIGYSADED